MIGAWIRSPVLSASAACPSRSGHNRCHSSGTPAPRRRPRHSKQRRTASCSVSLTRNAGRACLPSALNATGLRSLSGSRHNRTRKSAWHQDSETDLRDQAGASRSRLSAVLTELGRARLRPSLGRRRGRSLALPGMSSPIRPDSLVSPGIRILSLNTTPFLR